MAGVTTLLGGILGLGGNGTVWYVGAAVPGGALGRTGDFYLRTTTDDIYVKGSDGAWTIVLNIKGNPGADGTSGSLWFEGAGVPGSGLGSVGDFYLRTATGDVYTKGGGGWTIAINIKGADGTTPTVPYDLACFVAGQPDGTGVLVFQHKAARSFQLLAVDGVLAVAATANATWELRINGVMLVELHWTTGSTAVTIVGTIPGGGQAIAAGSIITLVSTVGATQPADIAVTVKGVLP
jgi:hypothetical protein